MENTVGAGGDPFMGSIKQWEQAYKTLFEFTEAARKESGYCKRVCASDGDDRTAYQRAEPWRVFVNCLVASRTALRAALDSNPEYRLKMLKDFRKWYDRMARSENSI